MPKARTGRPAGRQRKITDETLKQILEWTPRAGKTAVQLSAELNICEATIYTLRHRYQHLGFVYKKTFSGERICNG